MGKKAAAGAPLWMATFADLMSLLLTLFVLLLTFSEMDVVKYKAMAGSMKDAFGIAKKDKLAGVIEIEGAVKRKHAAQTDPTRSKIPTVSVELPAAEPQDFKIDAKAERDVQAEQLAEAVKEVVKKQADGLGVKVERSGGEVVMRFPSQIAFPAGSGEINQAFAAIIDELTPIIKQTKGQVKISGHTDNIPISDVRYRSNWDLSAARAASVVHRLIDYGGIEPKRITVQGYGESRPVAPNDTSENRAKNRRVEVSIRVPRKGEGGKAGNGGSPRDERPEDEEAPDFRER